MKKPLICFLLVFAFFNFSFAENDDNYSTPSDVLTTDLGDWNETDEPTYPPVEDNEYPVYNLTNAEISDYFHGDDGQTPGYYTTADGMIFHEVIMEPGDIFELYSSVHSGYQILAGFEESDLGLEPVGYYYGFIGDGETAHGGGDDDGNTTDSGDWNETDEPVPPTEGNETNPFADSIQIINSSLRGYIGDGDEALVYGFSLKARQKVFIHVRGSTLANFGLSADNILTDPKISLIDSAGVEIAENDDWINSFNSPEIESRISTSLNSVSLDRAESALLLDLEAGSYSLIVRPFDETTQKGTAVLTVEAAGISNITVRGLVGPDPFVHGIVLSDPSDSDAPAEVLASAKGSASLAQYGVSNGLSNPSITLLDSTNQQIGQNDDWISGLDLPRVRGFDKPKGAQEAALLSTLDKGTYTYLISSNGAEGTVLHEVFNLGTGSEADEVTTGEGKAPDSLSGLIMSYNEIEIDANGSELDLGWSDVKFDDNFVYSREFDFDTALWEEFQDSYTFEKNAENTATLVINSEDGGQTLIYLFFESDTQGNGEWSEVTMLDGTFNGRLYFELHDEEPIIVQPPVIVDRPLDENNTVADGNGSLLPSNNERPWDFWVNPTPDGLSFGWDNPVGRNYNLILNSGDQNLYYGGHPSEYADVNFAEFGLSENSPLYGEFWLYDDLTGEFILETPKFAIFPNFYGREPLRVTVDQHIAKDDFGNPLNYNEFGYPEITGFTLRWIEDGRYPADSEIITYLSVENEEGFLVDFRAGESSGNISDPTEKKIDFNFSELEIKGNELLRGEFRLTTSGDEVSFSDVYQINLSDWTGMASSAFVPDTLVGLKLRITEEINDYYTAPEDHQPDSDHEEHEGEGHEGEEHEGEEHDYDHEEHEEYGNHDFEDIHQSNFIDRSVTLGLNGKALIDGVEGYYEYTKLEGAGKLQLSWSVLEGDPSFFPVETNNTIVYTMYFDSDDFGYGAFSRETVQNGDVLGAENGDLNFEVIQHGWDVHYFTNENITELTGLEDAQAGYYFQGPEGFAEGYLEPVLEIAPSIFLSSDEEEDRLLVDFVKYPGPSSSDFVEKLPHAGFVFYEDTFGLPRKAVEHLERNYRWDDGSPIGYWEEERLDPVGMGIELVAHLDNGVQVIFFPDGEFWREFNPYARPVEERDAGLTFNSRASNYGSDKTNFGDGVFVDIRRVDGNESEYDSLMYRISLLNRELNEGEAPALEDFDLGASGLPAGTPVTITINYESQDPKYFLVSGAEVSAYKNRYPDEWLETPGSFTLKAKTVDPVSSESNKEDAISSTFSITVQMGAERYYGGAIFESNVMGMDLGFSKLSDPYDQTFSFELSGLPGTSTFVRALMPKSVLNHQFGIWEASEVKAVIRDTANGLRFIKGSRYADEEDGSEIGSNFSRIPHKGNEPEILDPFGMNYYAPMPGMADEFMLGDDEFGFDESVFDPEYIMPGIGGDYIDPAIGAVAPGVGEEVIDPAIAVAENLAGMDVFPSARRVGDVSNTQEKQSIPSKFDFDGDEIADSLLEISFDADVFPGDVQIGNPYIDPFQDVNVSELPTISGTIYDANGNSLNEFGVDFYTEVQDDFMGGFREYAMVWSFDNKGDGKYEAKLLPGEYYAEAWAWDPQTGKSYRSQVAEDSSGNPKTFVFEEGGKPITLDFYLQEEFMVPWEQGHVVSQLVNAEDTDAPLEIWGAFLDLTPVDPSNTGVDLTDYPVASLFVEYNGSINGHTPIGTYKVDIISHGSPMNPASDEQIIWTIEEGIINNFGNLAVKFKRTYTISGTIKDELGNGIWGDVVFVDPEDEDHYIWPEWVPMDHYNPETGVWTEPQPGAFKVSIPEGQYKILAQEHSGLYKNAYYNSNSSTSSFDAAEIVNISSDLDDLNISLSQGSVSTVNIRLENDSAEPIYGAWFNFYNGENEYEGVMFPQVDEAEGNYTLKVQPGKYKIEVHAPGYEPFFMKRDDFGDIVWQAGYWGSAAKFTAKKDETHDLGLAVMEGFEVDFGWTPPAWFYEEESEDEQHVPNVIKGKVLTDKGADVPGARIVVRSTDYIAWIEYDKFGQELVSRPNGTFEVEVPDGEWVVYAEPPHENDNFAGFRESNKDRSPISIGGDVVEVNDVNLVLQGSNINGRIMYPKKNRQTNEEKIVSVADAHIWVYTANSDGLPAYENDWFFEEDTTFFEEFSNTNEKGFFSLSMPVAGNYAMKIDLPGQLANFSPDPIKFTLEDPNNAIKVGTAIRVEWTGQGESKTIDVKRKIKGSDDSYKTVLDSDTGKLAAGTTFYVDNTIVPGKSYEYKVEAISGDVPVVVDGIRTSPPILYLAPPSSTISGSVLDADLKEIVGAEVAAWRVDGEGWASTFTDSKGDFSLSVGSGDWEVTVYRPMDKKVNWVYDELPKRALLKKDESKTIEPFIVSKLEGGSVTGAINLSDINASNSIDISSLIYVDVFDPRGQGDWTNPESDGNFTIPLRPGEYEVSIWVDPSLGGYADFEPRIVRVGKKAFDIGTIDFVKFSSTISGTIVSDKGKPIPGLEVWAWSHEGGWASTQTKSDGSYSLNVSPGNWEVGYDLPEVDGEAPPYIVQPPKRVRVRDQGEQKTLDFKAREAGAVVKGVVVSGDKPIIGLDAWVYAKEYTGLPIEGEFDDFETIIAEVPLSQDGVFSFPAVPGSYTVGLWLPPGSQYDFPGEKLFHVDLDSSGKAILTDENNTVITRAKFELDSISTSLAGSFKDDTGNLRGLVGEVFAMRLDGNGWRFANIEDDGTYQMVLPKGEWLVDYYIEYDEMDRNYTSFPAQPYRVEVEADQTLNFDLSKGDKISAKISGSVTGADLNNTSVYVWAYREENRVLSEFWNEVETDQNGSFTIPILPGGRYEVGVFLSGDLRDEGYLDAPVQTLRLKLDENVTDVVFALEKVSEENYISGTVEDANGSPLVGAYVYAWNHDGLEVDAITDAEGNFKFNVSEGSIWRVGGDYSEYDSNGSAVIYLPDNEIDVDLRNIGKVENVQVILKKPDFILPESTSVTFDPNKDFVTTLPDGTEVTILGGAANVDYSSVDKVKLVVTPTARVSRDADVKTADYAYSIELFNASTGKKIEGEFKKDVIIRVPVDVSALEENGVDLKTIEGKYYDATKNAWVSAKTTAFDENSSKLTMTTDHFSEYVVASSSNDSDIAGDSLGHSIGVKGWYENDWLGSFYDAGDNWIYHPELGWLYSEKIDSSNFWFYDEKLEWLWTGPEHYDSSNPEKSFFYSEKTGYWLYFNYVEGERYFYEYRNDDSSDWITPDK